MLSYDITTPRYLYNDKNLKPAHREFFTHIKGLVGHLGYCWATNKYLAQIASVSTRQVQRYIAKLETLGYIIIKIKRNKAGMITGREIWTRATWAERSEIKRVYGEKPIFQESLSNDKNVATPHDKNVVYRQIHNSTYKEKLVREEGVGETKVQKQPRQASETNSFFKKNKKKPQIPDKPVPKLTEKEEKNLKDLIPDSKERERRIQATIKFMMKKHSNAYIGKTLYDLIIMFWYKDQEKKATSNEEKKTANIESGRKTFSRIMNEFPFYAKYFEVTRDHIEMGEYTPGGGIPTVSLDDPELEEKLKAFIEKIRKSKR